METLNYGQLQAERKVYVWRNGRHELADAKNFSGTLGRARDQHGKVIRY